MCRPSRLNPARPKFRASEYVVTGLAEVGSIGATIAGTF